MEEHHCYSPENFGMDYVGAEDTASDSHDCLNWISDDILDIFTRYYEIAKNKAK